MNIAATVILYHPDESCVQNLITLKKKFQKVYIVDNTENSSGSFENHKNVFQDVIYLHDGKNRGIAERLNWVCELAKKDGYKWLLTMDQDSLFDDVMLTEYFQCITDFTEKEKVSMFGVTFEKQDAKTGNCDAVPVNHLITSGSVVNLNLLNEIGGFDENLFIDELDYEYCLRSIAKGFKIIQFPNIFLDHNLGKTTYHRSFKTIKRTSRNLHSAVRIYYMTRNFLYVQKKYQDIFPGEINDRKTILLNRLKNNILYNKNRFKVIRYILKGVIDYRKARMGKLK